jgi:hypothetical protein
MSIVTNYSDTMNLDQLGVHRLGIHALHSLPVSISRYDHSHLCSIKSNLNKMTISFLLCNQEDVSDEKKVSSEAKYEALEAMAQIASSALPVKIDKTQQKHLNTIDSPSLASNDQSTLASKRSIPLIVPKSFSVALPIARSRSNYTTIPNAHNTRHNNGDARIIDSIVPVLQPMPTIKPKRKRANARQLASLLDLYCSNPFPSAKDRTALAHKIGMDPRSVQIWFQNKRQAERHQKEPDS